MDPLPEIGTGSGSVVNRLVYRTVHGSVYADREVSEECSVETDDEDEDDDDNQSVDCAAPWTIPVILTISQSACRFIEIISASNAASHAQPRGGSRNVFVLKVGIFYSYLQGVFKGPVISLSPNRICPRRRL